MKSPILTFAGTWYPDKTTSSSKNLALPVILGVSLERKNVIFRVKVSCTRETINWLMLRSKKITESNILIVMICLTIVTLILIATSVPPMFGPGKLNRATLIMSEVCDTPITNNHGGTNSPTRNRHYILPDEDLQCGRSVAINIRVIIARPNPHRGRGWGGEGGRGPGPPSPFWKTNK